MFKSTKWLMNCKVVRARSVLLYYYHPHFTLHTPHSIHWIGFKYMYAVCRMHTFLYIFFFLFLISCFLLNAYYFGFGVFFSFYFLSYYYHTSTLHTFCSHLFVRFLLLFPLSYYMYIPTVRSNMVDSLLHSTFYSLFV